MESLSYRPPQEPLEILHEDRDMCVVGKPSGLLSVPGRGPELSDSALSRLRERHPGAQAVHRLDLGTSGVLAMALHRQSEGILRRQFQDRRTGKVYLALVEGMMPEDRGRIDLPLVRDWPNRPRQKVCSRTGRPSLTLYETVRREEDSTLVRLFPHTGRSHQLRVHLASLGHPIVGDNLYGPDLSPLSRLMLHASQLGLFHPRSGKWLVFTAPCPFAPDIAPTDGEMLPPDE